MRVEIIRNFDRDMTTVRLETPRLVLRRMTAADADAHIAFMQAPETARFLSPDGEPPERMDAWRQFASYLGHWEIRGFGFFSVIEKETGRWVGRVGPWRPEGWPGLEVGWGIAPDARGRGYAPEAAEAAVAWALEAFPELDRVISLIDPENAPSRAVAAKIGERKTDETFDLWGVALDVWAVERPAG